MLIWKLMLKELLEFYLQSSTRERIIIIISLILILFSILISLITPYMFKFLIKNINAPSNSFYQQNLILIGYLVLWGLGKLNIFFREILIVRASELWKKTLCLNYFKKIMNQFLKTQVQFEIGEKLATIERIQNSVPNLILTILLLLVPTIIEILLIICLISIHYGIYLGLIAIGTFIITLYINALSTKKLVHYQRIIKKSRSDIYKFTNDRLNNIQTILCEGTENTENHTYARKLNFYALSEIKSKVYAAKINIIQLSLMIGLYIYITLWSYIMINQGSINLYDFILINSFLINVVNPINAFTFVFRNVRRGVEDIYEALEDHDKKTCHNHSIIPLSSISGKIVLQNISFAYHNKVNVLEDINLTLLPSSKTAIVGISGSGKSTLCKILYALKPLNGIVTIDEIDRHKLDRSTLSNLFGVVSQTRGLFMESLLFNLTYGCPNYKKSDLDNIIELLGLSELISKLPEGLGSNLLAFGSNLSDGQKQKILIARLFLKAPKIIILDEATSCMDFKMESQVYKLLFSYLSSSTILVVSHRLSSIFNFCDQMVVLDNKKINAIGSHTKLIKENKIYESLWYQVQ